MCWLDGCKCGDFPPPLSLKGFKKPNSCKGHGRNSGFICQESVRFLSGMEPFPTVSMSATVKYSQGFEILLMTRSANPRRWLHGLRTCLFWASFTKASGFVFLKPVCDTIQSKEETPRVYGSTLRLSGTLLSWPLRLWVFQKPGLRPYDKDWRIQSQGNERDPGSKRGRCTGEKLEGKVIGLWLKGLSDKQPHTSCGELKGSEAHCWLGNGSGALTHKPSGAKILRIWCYTSASKQLQIRKSYLRHVRLLTGSRRKCLICKTVSQKTYLHFYQFNPLKADLRSRFLKA